MYEIAYYASPIGNMEIEGSLMGIRRIKIVDNQKSGMTSELRILRSCIQQLEEYFGGRRELFELKLDFSGATFFNQTVWRTLQDIPYGRTVTYSDIAKKIGKPKAVRAVGMASRLNPIPVIVPCHRVVGKHGELTGYFYGLETKQKLLQIENPMAYAFQGKLF